MLALSSSNQKRLLSLAFESLLSQFEGLGLPSFKSSDPELCQESGCFVTLHQKGQLRGCIGTFERQGPLYEKVPRMARAAAFQDLRFEHVSKKEVAELTLDISVLGEMKEISNLEEIEIGRHGVYVACDGKTGTLLPEVAVEHGMSREQFVLCCAQEKAGLKPEQIGRARLFIYEVFKFSGTLHDCKG